MNSASTLRLAGSICVKKTATMCLPGSVSSQRTTAPPALKGTGPSGLGSFIVISSTVMSSKASFETHDRPDMLRSRSSAGPSRPPSSMAASTL
jgi:hypothetical protein